MPSAYTPTIHRASVVLKLHALVSRLGVCTPSEWLVESNRESLGRKIFPVISCRGRVNYESLIRGGQLTLLPG